MKNKIKDIDYCIDKLQECLDSGYILRKQGYSYCLSHEYDLTTISQGLSIRELLINLEEE